MIAEDYVRNAKLIRVVDGDTLDVDVDLGFRMSMRLRVRVLGINCPETTGLTKTAGLAATAATTEWLARSGGIVLKTHLDKLDAFGRVLAEVVACNDGSSLGPWLLSQGHGIAFTREGIPC